MMVSRNVLRKGSTDCQNLRNQVLVLGELKSQALYFQLPTNNVLMRHQRKISLKNHLTNFQSNKTIKELFKAIVIESTILKVMQCIKLPDLSQSRVISTLVPSHLLRPEENSPRLIT